MKTRLGRTKLKEKDSSEILNTAKTKRSKVASKKKASKSLLPDQQQLEKEVFYDFRPCCVKIRKMVKENENPTMQCENAPTTAEKITDKMSNVPAKHQFRKSARTIEKQKRPPAEQFQDQKSDEEIHYDFGACRVKIKRLKLSGPSAAEHKAKGIEISTQEAISNATSTSKTFPKCNQMEKENEDPNLSTNKRNQSRNLRSIVKKNTDQFQNQQLHEELQNDFPRPMSALENKNHDSNSNGNEMSSLAVVNLESTETDIVAQPETNALKRYTFRNPGLSLTKRRAEELGLRKSSINDTEKTQDNDLNRVNKCTLFEPNKNSTMHALTSCSHSDVRSKRSMNAQSSSSRKVSKPIVNTEASRTENSKTKKTNALIPKKTNKKRMPKRQKTTSKPPLRVDNSSERDIYEFLSQSQNSDSDLYKHKDPASDIIKKLIEQGRVVVTKNRNGKPIVVHRKKKKTATWKNNQGFPKKTKNALKLNTQNQPINAVIIEEEEPDDFHGDFEGSIENDDVVPLVSDTPKILDNAVTRKRNSEIVLADQGTFSNLARSVLMQQTNQTNTVRRGAIDKKRLLEITQKHVSTPFQKSRATLLADGANLSPIPKSTTTETNKSLRNLSIRAMNFEHNSSYMPSLPTEMSGLSQVQSNSAFPNESIHRAPRETRQQSSLSSFSSNDSNGENMPPPSKVQPNDPYDENAVIFNARQTLNPRRTLPNRSPLQNINIIDVITLPPYRGPFTSNKKENTNKNEESHELSALQEYSNEDQSQLHEKSKSQNESSKPLFGFEEYLNEDEDDLHEESSNNNTRSSTASLHKQLKKLKKWRPNVLSRYKDAKSSTITKNIFDDDFNKKKGHQDIRNLLCSTMINEPSKKIQDTTAVSLLNSSENDSDEDFATTSKRNDALDLFGDPESTFDQTSLHRTYERPFKRKRKLQHQYSVVLDSEDESENENNHNTSVTKVAKRHKKNDNHREKSPNPELDKFVSEFNSMLKEAEEYELIVE